MLKHVWQHKYEQQHQELKTALRKCRDVKTIITP